MENEACFVFECPLSNTIRNRFPFLYLNVVLGSLKSFFQQNHKLDMSMYLIETSALHYSRELAFLTTSSRTSSRKSFMASKTLNSISI